jgi:formamidopyrimidine-DNA glycosylase
VPELPDVEVYIEALESRILGVILDRVRLASPFLLRSVTPPLESVNGRKVERLRRIGKRIAIGFDGNVWLVLHLMIAGRLHWKPPGVKLPGKRGLASFDFSTGSLLLTVVAGEQGLHALDPGGIEVLGGNFSDFAGALTAENHTLKRALTDPRTFSGIGNAYSDEILHHAKLSPVMLTQRLNDAEIRRLFDAIQETLNEWVDRLRKQADGKFPEHVTAFQKEMAAHGKYGQLCPRCGAKIQRIRYASNETNYCPNCQTGGKLLADRGLSRLLREDWPQTPEELESLLRRA